jgi:hypothetical protein
MQLTDEDKAWLSGLITTLNRQTEERNTAAIRESEQRTAAAIRESEQRTTAAIAAAVEASETRLLTAFHQWASPMDARVRTHAAAIRALDLETEALSDRVTKLEPPH